jgi:CheY-like chemotaxis protein
MPTKEMGFNSARILLAENNESNRKVTSLMLKRLGYRADAVTNGREVLLALEHQPYDIILMNLRMPEIDGFEATRMIRELCPKTVQPTIIALTAYILPNSKERCLDAGMNDFIAKPVKMDDLAAILSKHTRILELQAEFTQFQGEAFCNRDPFPKNERPIFPFDQDHSLKN